MLQLNLLEPYCKNKEIIIFLRYILVLRWATFVKYQLRLQFVRMWSNMVNTVIFIKQIVLQIMFYIMTYNVKWL